jgi:hypothetical protein
MNTMQCRGWPDQTLVLKMVSITLRPPVLAS